MSTHPATPHRAKLGSAQFASVEQHASPLGTANRHLSTAALRLSLSNGTYVATVSLAHAQTHATSSAAEEARPSRGSGMKTVKKIRAGQLASIQTVVCYARVIRLSSTADRRSRLPARDDIRATGTSLAGWHNGSHELGESARPEVLLQVCVTIS